MNSIEIKLLGGLALILGLWIGYQSWHHHVYEQGVTEGRSEIQDKWNKEKAAQIIADAKTRAKYDDIAGQLEAAKNERQIVTQTITKQVTKIVDRPVYRNICLDPDGLLLANQALAGKAASVATPAVPATTAP